jgi:proteasome lid subunit RPN8/RPN11
VVAQDSFQPVVESLGPAAEGLAGFAIFISRAAVMNIMRHGEKGLQTEHEVAGGLVGRPGTDPATGLHYTRITAALAVHGHADQYEVEIPPEEWFRLNNLVRDEEPYRGNSLLVGWYHSHPTFDAYLSELDQQTQRQFFGELWNVAIVVGPLRRQIRAFHSGHSTPCRLYLDPSETGDQLVEVTYEVSAGAVSTTAGVEWVDPLETPARQQSPLEFIAMSPDPDAALYPDLTADPLEEAAYYDPPAPSTNLVPAALTNLGLSPIVLGMLVLVAFLLLVLIMLTLLNMAGVRIGGTH